VYVRSEEKVLTMIGDDRKGDNLRNRFEFLSREYLYF